MNVEFCEDNSGTSKKMHYFRKNKVGAQAPPLDPPLHLATIFANETQAKGTLKAISFQWEIRLFINKIVYARRGF